MSEEFPSGADQLKSITQLIQNVILDAVKGNDVFVEDNLEKTRIEICNSCKRFDAESRRCKECGCFMDQKVSYSAAKCPLNYW
jgi:hypothetical protein